MTPDISQSQGINVKNTLKRIAFHTRFVILSKYTLAGVIVGIVGLLIYIPLRNSGDSTARLVFSNIEKGESITPRMINPRFQGVDGDNQPYVVTADAAVQRGGDMVDLNNIQGDITLNQDKSWLALSSKQGTLDLKGQTLQLTGDVTFLNEQGYEFRTQEMFVDMKQGMATGKTKVEGQGPPGMLYAEGFTANKLSGSLLFTGPVRMILYP